MALMVLTTRLFPQKASTDWRVSESDEQLFSSFPKYNLKIYYYFLDRDPTVTAIPEGKTLPPIIARCDREKWTEDCPSSAECKPCTYNCVCEGGASSCKTQCQGSEGTPNGNSSVPSTGLNRLKGGWIRWAIFFIIYKNLMLHRMEKIIILNRKGKSVAFQPCMYDTWGCSMNTVHMCHCFCATIWVVGDQAQTSFLIFNFQFLNFFSVLFFSIGFDWKMTSSIFIGPRYPWCPIYGSSFKKVSDLVSE